MDNGEYTVLENLFYSFLVAAIPYLLITFALWKFYWSILRVFVILAIIIFLVAEWIGVKNKNG